MARRVRRARSRRGWVAVAAMLLFALTPIAASSEGLAFGNLTPFGCIGNSGTGPRACIGADGLDSAGKIVVSPDGTSVYVASFSGNAVVAFARDPATGGLAFNGCFQQIGTGPSSVCTRIDGLKEASGLAVSPDGRNVYATGSNTGVVHVFARDAATGQLARIGCFQGTGANVAGCTSIDGLSARNVAVSPDGRNVYATGYRSVVVFVRDTATGQLIPNGCIGNSGTGPPACIGADGLDETDEITVSPDGKSVYVTSFGSNAVVEFARDTLTGNLTPIGCIGQSGMDPATCTSIDGLDGAGDISVSPDGRSVYVTASRSKAVVVFVRDSATSRLTPNGCIGNSGTGPPACIGADGLKGPTGVAVSPDGKNVYVASGFNDAVVMFARDTANGNLTPTGCIGQSDSGPRTCRGIDGLRAAWDLAVSPDGKYVYVVSFQSSAIVLFRRDTTAAPSPQPQPPSGSGVPVISQARVAPAAFKAAKRGGSTTTVTGTGTTVSYQDSQAAATTISVLKPTTGHLRAGNCLAGPARAGQRRCTRTVPLGSFPHNDTAGPDQLHFSGRIAGRTLARGSYVLALTPHANGRTGATIRLSFRIIS